MGLPVKPFPRFFIYNCGNCTSGGSRVNRPKHLSGVGIGSIGYSRSISIARRKQRKEKLRAATRGRARGKGGLGTAVVLATVMILAASIASTSAVDKKAEANAGFSTFTTPVVVNDNNANTQIAPSAVTGTSGEILVAWQDSRSGNEDVYFSKSVDEGGSFQANTRVDDGPGTSKQIEPMGAIADNGTIYVVWQDNRSSVIDYDVYMTSSSNGGSEFATDKKVDDSNNTISWQERPAIAVSSDGVILVAWTDDRSDIFRIRMTYSTDGGSSFTPSFEIPSSPDPGSGQTSVTVAANSAMFFIAYLDNASGLTHPYLTVTDTSFGAFGTPVRLDDTGTPGSAQRAVSIAPHLDRGVVAVWEDSRNGGWDVFGAIVSSSGNVEGPDFRVDDSPSGWDQRDPAIGTDIAGNIYAVWEDDRDDRYTIRFSYAVAGESFFQPSVAISAPGSNDFQRKPVMCVLRPGTIVVIWQDDSQGTYDIFASRGYIAELDIDIPEFSEAVVPLIVLASLVIVITARRNRRER